MTKRPFLPLLILLFAGSGCAALIYEVVWFQMLQLVIGSTGVSLGVLLGAFMGGMCLGSLFLPRYVGADRHPLRVYAFLELGIGAMALLLLVAIPLVGSAYLAIVPRGVGSILLRAMLAGLLLVPPTILMGATLPAISRWVEATPSGVSWMGFFYGGNTAGAVVGCLLAGFYLLRTYDIVIASFAAVAINVTVAGVALLLAARGASLSELGALAAAAAGGGASAVDGSGESPSSPSAATPASPPAPALSRGRHGAILIGTALSGLVALGAEVVWTRLMSLALGATTYTFSIILAVFLAALGLGSALGSYVSRHAPNPRTLFGLCQVAALVGVAWTAHAIADQLPYWPINPSIALDPNYVFQLDLARALWALAPAPFFWGASFPLAVAAAAEEGQDPAALVGRIYAANTIGAIVGSLAFGIFIIAWVGTMNAQRVLIVLAALAAVLLLGPSLGWRRASVGAASAGPASAGLASLARRVLLALGGVAAAIFLVVKVDPVPPVLIGYGRYAATYDPPETLYVGEGRNSSIAVTRLADGTRNLHVGGKIVASTEAQDMRVQGMLGHLTALLHDDPHSVLVVGFGAGVTAGTFVAHPGIDRIVIAEIEPLVVRGSAEFFSEANNDVLNDPRVEIVFDDARHFLQTTDERFDIITSDPIHPWMKGAAALYSEEYFQLVSDHLADGGVVSQWVPLYESNDDAVKSEMATFFRVFPDGAVWGNTYDGGGYDVVMAARKGGIHVDVDKYVERLMSPDHAFVAMNLTEVGFERSLDLLGAYAASAADLSDWLSDAEINRDKSLHLMYLAGLGLNQYQASKIYDEVLAPRTYPDGMFTGDPRRLAVLRDIMGFE